MNLLRSIYRKLPIVRELLQIKLALLQIKSSQVMAQLDSYTSHLLQQDRYRDPKNLNKHEKQVFSQGGGDGIITEIFRRVGCKSKTFVEIGVGNGLENNTAFLLFQNWSGYWIDGDEAAIRNIMHTFRKPIVEDHLKVKWAFLTAENIGSILQQLQIPEEIDLLSLDIDRNTYWIWAALPQLRPRVVVVEYNATIPASVDWKVDYYPERLWNDTSCFGASLKAYELLGRKLGYCLVGCTLNGIDAFFVREDLCEDKFEEPFTSERHFEPPRYFLVRREGHRSGFSDDA